MILSMLKNIALFLFSVITFLLFVNVSNAQFQYPGSVELKVGTGGQFGVTDTPTPTPTQQSVTPTVSPSPTSSNNILPTPTPTLTPIIVNKYYGPEPSVGATVGEYYLNLSGYSSPYSHISLISDDVILRSIVSDNNGTFSISDVLIKKGFSSFCLKANDAKSMGSSLTCLTTAPANASINIKNIFLPPSLALWKNNIAFYETDLAFGYTIPSANVTLYINSNQNMTIKADVSGYYRFILKLNPGKYTVYSTARYNNVNSRLPSSKLNLEVMDIFGVLLRLGTDFMGKLYTYLTSIVLSAVLIYETPWADIDYLLPFLA